jgi:DNA-binding IscR family transcriptional regulator
MSNQHVVQFAVMCLQALDDGAGIAMSPQDISKAKGVPVQECQRILHRFQEAGIVQFTKTGKVSLLRPVEELTAVEILDALWALETSSPSFQMLVGGNRGIRLRATLDCVNHYTTTGQELNG